MNSHQKMTAARTDLVLLDPFFGSLALGLTLKSDPGCGTAYTDGRVLGYDPAFIEPMPHGTVKALIAHEVMHCAMGHPWRRDGRDFEGWNVSADKAINGDLKASGYTLPDGVLYPNAGDEGKSAEWYYARKQETDSDSGDGDGAGDDPSGGQGPSTPNPMGEVRDAPTGPDESGEPAPTESDWKQKTQEALNAAKIAGKVPGGIARMVSAALAPRIDVKALLLRFFSERAAADYSWTRPNTRYLSQGLYLPALESKAMGEVAVLCDTSGSTSSVSLGYARKILEQVLEEVQPAGVTLYMVDTEVHTVHRMERGDSLTWEPKGGGGTDFTTFFDGIEQGEYQPVCIIGISDLAATFGNAPSVPVLWLTDTQGGTAPFGEVIELPI